MCGTAVVDEIAERWDQAHPMSMKMELREEDGPHPKIIVVPSMQAVVEMMA
jgi:hypothetical protein